MTTQDAQASNQVVTGTIHICGHSAHVLFDPGATHSFVSQQFAPCLGVSATPLVEPMLVGTPVGNALQVGREYRACVVSLVGRDTLADFLLLGPMEFDAILGMDWLASCHASLDCRLKRVYFDLPGQDLFYIQGIGLKGLAG